MPDLALRGPITSKSFNTEIRRRIVNKVPFLTDQSVHRVAGIDIVLFYCGPQSILVVLISGDSI